MASQNVLLQAKGLYTYYQSLMEVPPGALLEANNVVINRDGVIEPRRGIQYYGSSFGISSDRAKQLMEYKGVIFRHYSNLLAYDNGSGTFTTFAGTYLEPVSGFRIKSTETSSNFYFTTSKGVKKISATSSADFSIANVIEDAGGPKAIDGTATIDYTTVGFLDANYNCAYRILWGIKDRNSNLILGTPSMRIIAQNKSTVNNTSVKLTFGIPYTVTSTDYIFKIYRSESTLLTPSDELNLVFEGNPTSAELTLGKIEYTDFLDDSLRIGGAPLYTNQYSGEGALAANEPPPLSRDITTFKGHTFYANTRTRHKTILNVLSTVNLVSGVSTITISDGTVTNVYTFVGAKESTRITCLAKAAITDTAYFLMNNASNTRKYYVWYDKTGTSTAPANAETLGRIGIRINVSSGGIVTATDIANTTAVTIAAAASYDFAASNSGADLTVTNVTNGNCTDTVDGTFVPTGFTFLVLAQGDGEDAALKHVLLSDNASITQAVEDTARSLANIINAQSAEIVSAFYLSGVDDVPGQILIERKTLEDLSFYIGASSATVAAAFSPELGSGATFTTKLVSDNSRKANRLYFSKPFEPEAVPTLQYFDVGSLDQDIFRIVALRESLFILKGDGIFRLTGDDKNNFNVTVFDNTCIIKAPDTAVTLTNQCYFFSNQGVVRLNESSSEPVSRPIEDKLLPYISTNPNLATASFAVSYESDRSLLMWTVSSKTDTIAQVCYRFNTFTNSWTEWKIPKTCSVLNRTQDKLYFGSGAANVLEKERKNFDRFDYADREIASTLPASAQNGNVLKPTSFTSIETEDVLAQKQYVTIYQMNMLLRKLDLDNGLAIHGFYTALNVTNGDDLSNKMTQLVVKLNMADTSGFTDTHANTSYVFSGTTNQVTLQTEFNRIIDRLNQSPTPYFTNYVLSAGSVLMEVIVIEVDNILKTVTTNIIPAFVVGDLIIYKGIKLEVEYAPQHTGDPSTFKQFSQGTLMFERRSFYTAHVAYSSDASNAYEEISFIPKASGSWGEFSFGDGSVWGGLGDQVQLRTYIPTKKQRCRFLGCRFTHGVALESLSLYGISLTFSVYSERAYSR